jgi:hypothetical protein
MLLTLWNSSSFRRPWCWNNLLPILCLAEHSKVTSYPILAMLLLSSLTVKLSWFNSLVVHGLGVDWSWADPGQCK